MGGILRALCVGLPSTQLSPSPQELPRKVGIFFFNFLLFNSNSVSQHIVPISFNVEFSNTSVVYNTQC